MLWACFSARPGLLFTPQDVRFECEAVCGNITTIITMISALVFVKRIYS